MKKDNNDNYILSADELDALTAFSLPLTSDERLRIGYFWSQVRYQLVAVTSLFYSIFLLFSTPFIVSRLGIDEQLRLTFEGYLYARGLLLLLMLVIYCISWKLDWNTVNIHLALLWVGIITFTFDIVLIYTEFSINSAVIFTVSIMIRILALLALAANIFSKKTLMPKDLRRVMGVSWTALLRKNEQ